MLPVLACLAVLHATPPDAIGTADFDKAAVKRLVDRCKESSSLRLVVLKDGKTVIAESFGNRQTMTNLMSATKSVTALAVGFLLDEGKIPSIETPVSAFFPDYKQGEKANETVRNFVEHTSGIKNYDQSDFGAAATAAYRRVEKALEAPIESAPGTYWRYSDRGVDLLSGIVRKAAGQPMDEYLNSKLFGPLDIPKPLWLKDGAGDPHGSAELVISAESMAKIGQLMLDKGVYNGKRLLSQKFVEQALTPSAASPDDSPCGWLWWLIDPWFTLGDSGLKALEKAGTPPAMLEMLKPLKGRHWPSMTHMLLDMMHAVGGGAEGNKLQAICTQDGFDLKALESGKKGKTHKVVGFFASGWGGQYILVLPAQHIVAVRTCVAGNWDADPSKYEMGDFYALVRALA